AQEGGTRVRTSMATKRALVVDDSKSARLSLSRMLEQHRLEVDGAESAEQAIEYLTHHRPDVIFMDHLMPGMDGFQALAAIKNNPRTATIPVLMYTSQEGELYVGQARALGAVGVLPKQARTSDLSKVLYELHLLPDRRSSVGIALHADSSPVGPGTVEVGTPEAALREQFWELRRSLGASLDSRFERLEASFTAAVEKALAWVPQPSRARRRTSASGIAAAAAVIAAAAGLWVIHRQSVDRQVLDDAIVQLDTALASGGTAAAQPAEPAAAASAPMQPAVQPAVQAQATGGGSIRPIVEAVPYGDSPLGGPRLEVLRQLFDRLIARGYHGTVEIDIFHGRFCQTGDAGQGLTLAPGDMPYSQCAATTAQTDPSAAGSSEPPSDVPVGFADRAANLRSASHGTADVEVEVGSPRSTIVSYPPVSDSLTAAEWNSAAAANNRIEIRVP
ncbi:MAG: response regulator, partial [Steroidobacteraceae bacterium]